MPVPSAAVPSIEVGDEKSGGDALVTEGSGEVNLLPRGLIG